MELKRISRGLLRGGVEFVADSMFSMDRGRAFFCSAMVRSSSGGSIEVVIQNLATSMGMLFTVGEGHPQTMIETTTKSQSLVNRLRRVVGLSPRRSFEKIDKAQDALRWYGYAWSDGYKPSDQEQIVEFLRRRGTRFQNEDELVSWMAAKR